MRPTRIASRLQGFEARGAGTDAERRAALWLVDELTAAGRQVSVQTFWCRPSWAFAHAWHAALALAGSLVSIASAPAGGAMLLIASVSVLADDFAGVSLGRRLTPERASQNVIAAAPPNPDASADSDRQGRVRLTIAANYDAGRMGLAYRDGIRRASAAVERASHGLAPGWLGWLSVANVWLLAIAVLRLEAHHSHAIGIVQLPPTVGLVFAAALLVEIATSDFSPAAGDNGSGVAAAIALARALDAAPPHALDVELVLAGAGDGSQIGMRRYLQARRRERNAVNTVVVGIAPCSAGASRWWTGDGSLIPFRYAQRLRQVAATAASEGPYLHAGPHRGRGATAALPARRLRIPALAIGCLDPSGIVPRSHQRTDTAATVDERAIDEAVQFGLLLVEAIDTALAQQRAPTRPTPA